MSSLFESFPVDFRRRFEGAFPGIGGGTQVDYAGRYMEGLLNSPNHQLVGAVGDLGVVFQYVPNGRLQIVLNPELPELKCLAPDSKETPETDPFFMVRTNTELSPRFQKLLQPQGRVR